VTAYNYEYEICKQQHHENNEEYLQRNWHASITIKVFHVLIEPVDSCVGPIFVLLTAQFYSFLFIVLHEQGACDDRTRVRAGNIVKQFRHGYFLIILFSLS